MQGAVSGTCGREEVGLASSRALPLQLGVSIADKAGTKVTQEQRHVISVCQHTRVCAVVYAWCRQSHCAYNMLKSTHMRAHTLHMQQSLNTIKHNHTHTHTHEYELLTSGAHLLLYDGQVCVQHTMR